MTELIRPLTPTQARVAALVAKGYSYVRIGHELAMSRHTARFHVRCIATMLDHYDPSLTAYKAVILWASRQDFDASAT